MTPNHPTPHDPTTTTDQHLSAPTWWRIIRKALLTRLVEERLLELYHQGMLSGTIHTCIGQELSGAVVTECLEPGDTIFSNHRCHGHFLSFTDQAEGLIAEIMGKATGVCGGRGGSQHLCYGGFYANGVQGGIVPVAAGLALAHALDGNRRIATVFIGDGTLGEGVLYETLNIVAKWELPLLVVVENNHYAQSTHQRETLAGTIADRAAAFAIPYASGTTWEWEQLYATTRELVATMRHTGRPALLQIDTVRLKAHSKGDDTRDPSEIAPFEARDPLNRLLAAGSTTIQALHADLMARVDRAVEAAAAADDPELRPQHPAPVPAWRTHHLPTAQRMVSAIHEALATLLERSPRTLLLGEDIRAPYGGAFKVTQELSLRYPERVRNTPISEAAIVGLGSGLALGGYLALVEIMFGDFMTLTLDQILNHAAKFREMYDEQVRTTFIVRTPMGGGRGYGPTHSQTLERHFLGIPGLSIVALTTLMAPLQLYERIVTERLSVTLVLEQKALYPRHLRATLPPGFRALATDEAFPTIWVKPESSSVDVTLIGYGGTSEMLVEVAVQLFQEDDLVAQIFCPTQIYPFDVGPLLAPLATSRMLVLVEEGQGFASFSSEVIAQLAERAPTLLQRVVRVMPPPTIIPAAALLERATLPGVAQILAAVRRHMATSA